MEYFYYISQAESEQIAFSLTNTLGTLQTISNVGFDVGVNGDKEYPMILSFISMC
jgi:hypothetical protein